MRNPIAAIVVAAALSASAAGCFGSYSAFHAVHRWNAGVSGDKWVRSGVHLGLWIIPVYELTIVGDFFLFNTIEHLTDKPVFR